MAFRRKTLQENVYEIGSGESLASARTLRRLADEYGSIQEAARVAKVAYTNALGIVTLMRRWPRNVSEERIAAVCYTDEGVTPEDVAGWFGKPLWWAVQVYTEQAELRHRWPAARGIERQAVGILPNDPTYDAIKQGCAEIIARDPAPWKRVKGRSTLAKELSYARFCRGA